jgi:hypothetical protein
MIWGIGLSKELKTWQSEFKQTLSKIEHRGSHETVGLSEQVTRSLDLLDQMQVDQAQKRKALADALINHPKAIKLVADLRGARSGEELLKNVKVGLVQARAATMSQQEIRDAATQVINTGRDVKNRGANIDKAFTRAPATHLGDIKRLADSADGRVLKDFLRDHRGASIHLDGNLYLTTKGLRVLDGKNKLRRPKEEHVAQVYEGDLAATIALRVADVANGTIQQHLRQS